MKKTTIMAKIIKTDGTIVEVTPQNGTDFQLEELQKIVGGYIEVLRLTDNEIMVAKRGRKVLLRLQSRSDADSQRV